MIAIVNYNMGNLGSIKNMLARIGVSSIITSDPQVIDSAEKLILPGVGAFDSAVEQLRSLNLMPVLNENVIGRNKPLLGICLGMQLLSKESEEGKLPGLGWIDARTIRFKFESNLPTLRLPHMGWNQITATQSHSIMTDCDRESRFYFVHTYHVICSDPRNVLATTNYGIIFHSAIVHNNILGTQFHPEKSHKFGMKLLKRFAEI